MSERSNRNRFEHDSKYFTISVYTIATISICALIIKLIFSWDETIQLFKQFLVTIWPFLFGFLIAYFINPLVQWIDRKLLKDTCHIRSPKTRLLIALLSAYLIFIGAIVTILIYLIPQVTQSISELWKSAQTWPEQIEQLLTKVQEYFPQLDLSNIGEQLEQSILSFFDANKIGSIASGIIPMLFSSAVGLVNLVFNIFITLIVSVHMIVDRYRLGKASAKLVRAIFKERTANQIISTLNTCNHVFSRFLVGKTVDSLIIGILCFIAMSCLRLPYALIISIIVGVTNMIPYFGPFVGAIPGALIILMIDPIQVFIYLFMILVLQQFDGLYLGPKILGDSTGLRPIWIIFAITIGGHFAGVLGMFLGVPVVAVCSYLINEWTDKRLKQKNISPEEANAMPEGGGLEGSDALETKAIPLPTNLEFDDETEKDT